MATIKRQLQLVLPGTRAFLDVDDLDDIMRLDEYIAQSALLLLFVSANYFGSRACQAEIKSTLKWHTPIVLLHEADPNHGGKPWAEFEAECPETLEAEGHPAPPGYNTTGRGYPDVAFPGINYLYVKGGEPYLVSGTSASTPAFAGVISLVNAERVRRGPRPGGPGPPAGPGRRGSAL